MSKGILPRIAGACLCMAVWLAAGHALFSAQNEKGDDGKGVVARKTEVKWFGHGYFLLTSATGIRVAIDPFEKEFLTYPIPQKIAADVTLVTHESNDANAVDQVVGDPQVFRSTTAAGVNRGSGVLFKGSKSFRNIDRGAMGGRNVMFSFKLDGIRFAHLGGLGHQLDGQDVESVGTSDVVIVPAGFQSVFPPAEVMKTAKKLGAKIVVPAFYATQYSSNMKLGTLDAFLAGQTVQVRRLESAGFKLTVNELPKEMEIWVLNIP